MKVKKVVLHGYYNSGGEYIPFEGNTHHGKTYYNVDVSIETKFRSLRNGSLGIIDFIKIEGCEPIQCELVDWQKTADGTLVISLCQNWVGVPFLGG